MPELPEVETVARQLDPLLRGGWVLGIEVYDPTVAEPRVGEVVGMHVDRVFRRGKQVVIQLDEPGARRWLAIHLRMTGRLLFGEAGADERHLRMRFELDRGWLRFVDPRRFGTVRIHRTLAETRPAGLEPLSRQHTAAALAGLLAGSSQPLKPWLLRQDRLVGIGNIYASEILFAARLSPDRPAGDLSPAEVRRLHRAVRRVLRAAIEACGTTFSDFQDARGTEGSFGELLTVYGRAGQPCRRCSGTVTRVVQAGRSTFWCERCQDSEGAGH